VIPVSNTKSKPSTDVVYHSPGVYGECDDCESAHKRPTHRMPDGDDICAYCYGVRKGYVEGSA
jgi:hypothetical protein